MGSDLPAWPALIHTDMGVTVTSARSEPLSRH
jgi:hypothetical protein